MSLIEEVNSLKEKFKTEASDIRDLKALEQLRVDYLGRKGIISTQFDRMREIPPEERRAFGKTLNEIKNIVSNQLDELKKTLGAIGHKKELLDHTLPGRKDFIGGLHPLTYIMDEIIDIFRGMGFVVETGPEAETAYYNFDALNTPFWHPARDLTDTFYLDLPAEKHKSWLLRTETSPVQIRVMERQKPPIRIIAPGRVYRNDKPDASHSPIFMQVEGLYVDKGVTMADLKGTVLTFYRAIFGPDTETRFRPHFFPFTEPSAEVDVTCIFCKGKGCRVCKKSGWLEMGGSGMVDPNVLEGVGIDSEVYTGWAFGLGIERIAMLKYGVDDIRLFYENDLRFLEQF
ncbi:MAG: phenylalanine--tRNA ligase subunit alpha [Candidatus Hatepunaea meridiana]|nr:phenylalanine--tRNA ligase subunit alpha [Candidatus Hatepunaea meridiana]